mmetsp:Transcript_47298/g.148693  ORF Transcript_47298/g.148693 Transcript_47298/m.148693 type:complete len:211 (-) Transcript_47298:145-777(-)
MQCAALRGVSAIVQSGTACCGGKRLRVHSKQLDTQGYMTRTCPEKPSVPPSTRGMTEVRSGLRCPVSMSTSKVTSEHAIALSHRRASIESSPITMTWNWRYQSAGLSWIGQKCASTATPEMRFMMNSAATVAFGRPTSALRKRNCRLRFETSIVSMSMTSILPKPESARSLRSSQPSPPAPTTSTRACCCMNERISGDGSKGSGGSKIVP